MTIKITPTNLPEVLLIEPQVHGDERGFFLESYNLNAFKEAGLNVKFVQDNHSRSKKGVLRGLHFQLATPQAKLVRVATGAVFDVAVDIRQGSPRFGQWVGCLLSDKNHRQLYVPAGFAHGFRVVSEQADFIYKCTGFYDQDDEQGIAWDDSDIGIEWPGQDPILSDRDKNNPKLKNMTRLPVYSQPS